MAFFHHKICYRKKFFPRGTVLEKRIRLYYVGEKGGEPVADYEQKD
jgi:hypothetical protein